MRSIQVTRAFLPPLPDVVRFLERAWSAGQLTNNGQLVQELEKELCEQLKLSRLLMAANGTVALELALEAVKARGDVVTTPFSYVATTSSILWARCEPVFVDIDPDTLCIDAGRAADAVTSTTSAVMATHVYGIPCDVERLEAVSRGGCPVIYDAAHAFGVELKGRSLLDYGDLSTLSFHATKIFHTGEGGAVVARTAELHERVKLIRSFGHVGDEHFCLGINGKMSELHAAVGLAVLPHLRRIREARARSWHRYRAVLSDPRIRFPRIPEGLTYNFSYAPVIFASETAQERVRNALNDHGIFPRRYFYPSLNTLPYVKSRAACPVSEDAARTVLCLPLYADLAEADVERVCELILAAV